MNRFRIAALWTCGKLLALLVFLATSLASCSGVFLASSAVFYPEQTVFPDGETPKTFLVVVEHRRPPNAEEPYTVVALDRVAQYLADNPQGLRLSQKSYSYSDSDPWGFKVIEETPLLQVIALEHRNTQGIKTRYRVEGGRVTPLSYKTDGGIMHTLYLLPLFLLCLWLGVVAARRATRWVPRAITAARSSAQGNSG